jgi:hypothetical protein
MRRGSIQQEEQGAAHQLKPEFAGIAKKTNWKKKIASRSLVPGKIPQDHSDSDSEVEPHESSNMAVTMEWQ